jgi:hypothetical protein
VPSARRPPPTRAGSPGPSPTSFSNAVTGVSRSASTSTLTGTTEWVRASSRNAGRSTEIIAPEAKPGQIEASSSRNGTAVKTSTKNDASRDTLLVNSNTPKTTITAPDATFTGRIHRRIDFSAPNARRKSRGR